MNITLDNIESLSNDYSYLIDCYRYLIGGPVDSAVPLEWLTKLNELCPGIESKFFWNYTFERVFGEPILASRMFLDVLKLMLPKCKELDKSFISKAQKCVFGDTETLVHDYMILSSNLVTNAKGNYALVPQRTDMGISNEKFVWLYVDIMGSGRPVFVSDIRKEYFDLLLLENCFNLNSCET